MDYQLLTDSTLARLTCDIITELEVLEKRIQCYLRVKDSKQKEEIINIYTQLQYKIAKIGLYVSLEKNKHGSDLYKYYFVNSFKKAYSYILHSVTKLIIDKEYLGNVSDTIYNLTRYKSKDMWLSYL